MVKSKLRRIGHPFLLFFFLMVGGALSQAEDKSQETPAGLTKAIVSGCDAQFSQQEVQIQELMSFEKRLEEISSGDIDISSYEEIRGIWVQITGLVYRAGSYDFVAKDALCEEKLEGQKNKARSLALSLFVLSSQLRSESIGRLRDKEADQLFEWNQSFFEDHLLEVKMVPLRWIAIFSSKVQRFEDDLDGGVDGWMRLFRDAFWLCLFLFGLGAFISLS